MIAKTCSIILGLALSAAIAIAGETQQPILFPTGWALCDTGVAINVGCSSTAPGEEPSLLLVQATSANTTGFLYVVTGTRADGTAFRAQGYFGRADNWQGYSYTLLLKVGRVHDVTITITEVVPIATQTARQ